MLAAPLESVPIMAVWRRLSDEEWEMTGDALASRRSGVTRCCYPLCESHGGRRGAAGMRWNTGIRGAGGQPVLKYYFAANTARCIHCLHVIYIGDVMSDGSVQPLLIISLRVIFMLLF